MNHSGILLITLAILSAPFSKAFGEEISLTGISSQYGTDCVGNPFVVAGVVPTDRLASKDIAEKSLGQIVIQSLVCAEDAILIGINGVTYKLEAKPIRGFYKWTDLLYQDATSKTSVSLKIIKKLGSAYDPGTECTTEFNKVRITVRVGERQAAFVGTTGGGCP